MIQKFNDFINESVSEGGYENYAKVVKFFKKYWPTYPTKSIGSHISNLYKGSKMSSRIIGASSGIPSRGKYEDLCKNSGKGKVDSFIQKTLDGIDEEYLKESRIQESNSSEISLRNFSWNNSKKPQNKLLRDYPIGTWFDITKGEYNGWKAYIDDFKIKDGNLFLSYRAIKGGSSTSSEVVDEKTFKSLKYTDNVYTLSSLGVKPIIHPRKKRFLQYLPHFSSGLSLWREHMQSERKDKMLTSYPELEPSELDILISITQKNTENQNKKTETNKLKAKDVANKFRIDGRNPKRIDLTTLKRIEKLDKNIAFWIFSQQKNFFNKFKASSNTPFSIEKDLSSFISGKIIFSYPSSSNNWDYPGFGDEKILKDYMASLGFRFISEKRGDSYSWEDDKGGSGRSFDYFLTFEL